jgi:hypothetical protein
MKVFKNPIVYEAASKKQLKYWIPVPAGMFKS